MDRNPICQIKTITDFEDLDDFFKELDKHHYQPVEAKWIPHPTKPGRKIYAIGVVRKDDQQ